MSSEYITEYRKLKTTFIILLSITTLLLAIFIVGLIEGINKNKLDFEMILTFIWLLGLPWGIWYWVNNWRNGKVVVFIGFLFGIFILPYGIYKHVTSLKQHLKLIEENNRECVDAANEKPDENLDNIMQ